MHEYITKKELDKELDSYEKAFVDIEKEANKKIPDAKKIISLCSIGKSIQKTKSLISLHPKTVNKKKFNIRNCAYCGVEFESNTMAFHRDYCRKKSADENKKDTWKDNFEKFKKHFEEFKTIPFPSWGHRQRLRRSVPEDQKKLLLKLSPDFFTMDTINTLKDK